MKDPYQIVTRMEELARLRIPEDEKASFSEQIGRILDMVAKLNECPTENTAPLTHILPLENVLRDDQPVDWLDRTVFMELAPEHADSSFVVPPVI